MLRFLAAALDLDTPNTLTAQAKAAQVNRRTLYDWFERPEFMAWFNQERERLLRRYYDRALLRAGQLAEQGSPDHLKLLMAKFGDLRHGSYGDGDTDHGRPQTAVYINVPRPEQPARVDVAAPMTIDITPRPMLPPTSDQEH